MSSTLSLSPSVPMVPKIASYPNTVRQMQLDAALFACLLNTEGEQVLTGEALRTKNPQLVAVLTEKFGPRRPNIVHVDAFEISYDPETTWFSVTGQTTRVALLYGLRDLGVMILTYQLTETQITQVIALVANPERAA